MNNPFAKSTACIGIPTYKRPHLLGPLLDSLLREIGEGSATILIADNEPSAAVEEIVRSYRDQIKSIFYIPVTARGISHNRNALIDAAYIHSPDFQWLLMYDDDALIDVGSARKLLAYAMKEHADLAGGPTIGQFPDDFRNIFVRNSVLGRRSRWPNGKIDRLEITQNLLISRKILDDMPRPIFNKEFGLTGGEDYDFFTRARDAGFEQYWCDEAVIHEAVSVDRLSTRSIFYRAYSSGISIIMVDKQFQKRGALLLGNLGGLGRCSASTLVCGIRRNHNDAARSLLGIAYYIGRFAWLLGFRSERYR